VKSLLVNIIEWLEYQYGGMGYRLAPLLTGLIILGVLLFSGAFYLFFNHPGFLWWNWVAGGLVFLSALLSIGRSLRARFLTVYAFAGIFLLLGAFQLWTLYPRLSWLLWVNAVLLILYACSALVMARTASKNFYGNPFSDWLEANKIRRFSDNEVSKTAERLARPSLRIEKLKTDVKIGDSKIGGLPDLPDSIQWPSFRDKPMAFVAQFRLSDLAGQSQASHLPGSGMLYFFYDEEQAWGFDPKDKGFISVQYFPEEKGLARRAAPKWHTREVSFRESAVRFREESSYAIDNDSLLKDMPNDLVDLCREYIEAKLGKGPRHRLFGCPDTIQGDMMRECQLVTHGINCGEPFGDKDAKIKKQVKELEKGAGDWKLLLQIDSDDDLEMMWGDSGRIYFCATDAMLRERRFGDMWAVLQCY
jgi:uncharacterized protein YwqG